MMKQLTVIKQSLVAACLLGFAQLASAGVVGFNPDTTLAAENDTIFVDLIWSGNAGEYLGDWDVDISYDASVVSYQGASIDPDFAVDFFGCVICGDDSIVGTIDLFETSLDGPADLAANQDSFGNAFVLATLEFLALAPGQTALALSGIFGDEDGVGIDPTLDNGRICVGPDGCGVAAVPEPSTLPLILLGLLPGIVGLRRKRSA